MLGDPRPAAVGAYLPVSDVLADVASRISDSIEPLVRNAPTDGPVDLRWYWAAPLHLDRESHPLVTNRLLTERDLTHWGGDKSDDGLRAHVAEAKSMLEYGPEALGRPPADLSEVLAELAVSGPAQCALRAISSVTGLPIADESTVLKRRTSRCRVQKILQRTGSYGNHRRWEFG